MKLLDSAMRFNLHCLNKLKEKEKEGWIGWDDKKKKCLFENRLKHDIFCELTQNRLVNIANYCNFLWNLIEEKGGEIIE